ncbi:MAG: caspase domain-containing protein [Chryseotalea sp.]
MKKVHTLLLFFALLFTTQATAQNLNARSSEFEIDLSKQKNINADIPIISWQSPIPDLSFSEDGKVNIKFTVDATSPLKSVTLAIKENDMRTNKAMQTLRPNETELNHMLVDKRLTLLDGENNIVITAENVAGIKTTSVKKINVGAEAIANATTLDRTDYALIFATDQYEYWSDLVNPVFDSRTIGEELKLRYGFKVEIVENPTQAEILKKLREYAEKKYKPLDQLFIFFAGHGNYDQTFGEGFVVTTESLINDEGKTSYLSHNRLRSIINNIQCEHIFLTMDVCFGGTFDEALASSRGAVEDIYKEQGKNEFVSRKLLSKTRKYLTSGGKTYVSDGIKGQHSPFAKNFLEALYSKGGSDGILTLTELFTFVEKLKIKPKFGAFGDNAPESDFLFIAR